MPLAQIEFTDLQFLEKCGSGSFGAVYRAKWKSKEKFVAVKLLNLDDEHEANILSQLSHKNIVQLYGAVSQSPGTGLVTEYAELGSLFDFLDKNVLHFLQLLDWSMQIAAGINYLHNEAPAKIIHRDLKSKNVVITSSHAVKICDFGSSRAHAQTTAMTLVGTYPWMAPEVIQSLPISEAADTFSYGVVLWEMLTSEVPFKGMEGVQVAYLVAAKDERLPIPRCCPEAFASLLRKCWQTDPKKRPTFPEIKASLVKLSVDENLKDETDSFVARKDEWRTEIDDAVTQLKALQKNLTLKEKELQERELRLVNHERLRKDAYKNQFKTLTKTALEDWNELDVPSGIDVFNYMEDDDDDEFFIWLQLIAQRSVHLYQYADTFHHNNINGRRLPRLTLEHLKDLGITSYGHRLELQEEINTLVHEIEHLSHFPPLDSRIGTLLRSPDEISLLHLTILIGSHCCTDPKSKECKWKLFAEFVCTADVMRVVQDVAFFVRDRNEEIRLREAPFVMRRWLISDVRATSPDVECVINFEAIVDSPKVQRYRFPVSFTPGSTSTQKMVELTLVPSHLLGDDSHDTLCSTDFPTSPLKSITDQQDTFAVVGKATPVKETWASKVANHIPKGYSPRRISFSNQQVAMQQAKAKDNRQQQCHRANRTANNTSMSRAPSDAKPIHYQRGYSDDHTQTRSRMTAPKKGPATR